jgi:hypothetical protein
MFDRHYHTTIHEDHSREAAKILGDKLESISNAEIKSKDRVDITLAEYEKLKNDVRKYEERSRRMGSMIMRLGIPYEVIDLIDTGSIEVRTCEDPMNFKRHYEIKFTADDFLRKGL